MIILVLVWRKSIHFRRFFAKNDFTFSFLTFSPLVTPIGRYVSTKLEVSTALLFVENPRHGTDGQTHRWSATLNARG